MTDTLMLAITARVRLNHLAPPADPMTLTGTLPNATAGAAYTGTLTLGGTFTAPVTIDASAGSIPSWMTPTVSGNTVTFTGTAPASAETDTFTVRGTDSSATPQVATAPQSVVVSAGTTTFAQGVDFRNSLAYVTDPANCDGYIGNTAYPVAATSGQSIGWVSTSGIGRRDRSTTVDPRLAGVNFISAIGGQQTFRMSLPAAGAYALTLALGDQSSQIRGSAAIYDGATLLATVNTPTNGTSAGGHFVDANGTDFASAAAWVSGNKPLNLTFAGTQLNIVLSLPTTGGVAEMGIAHLKVESA